MDVASVSLNISLQRKLLISQGPSHLNEEYLRESEGNELYVVIATVLNHCLSSAA